MALHWKPDQHVSMIGKKYALESAVTWLQGKVVCADTPRSPPPTRRELTKSTHVKTWGIVTEDPRQGYAIRPPSVRPVDPDDRVYVAPLHPRTGNPADNAPAAQLQTHFNTLIHNTTARG
ncbi:unnamed protein product [Gadus morhua 'NCC']